MPSPRTRPAPRPAAELVLETPEASLLDLLDRVLSKGVMATGDLTLGVAGVDLIYVRLSALVCAADRVLARTAPAPARKPRRKPRRRVRR